MDRSTNSGLSSESASLAAVYVRSLKVCEFSVKALDFRHGPTEEADAFRGRPQRKIGGESHLLIKRHSLDKKGALRTPIVHPADLHDSTIGSVVEGLGGVEALP